MRNKLSLRYSFELIFAAITIAGIVATLDTFVVGRHYIIPSGILAATVLTGNLAWWGFRDAAWAKYVLFWTGFLFTGHALFALFFSKRYREILGGYFEPVCSIVVLLLALLVWQYARRNALFRR
jgi:hypothetical protein